MTLSTATVPAGMSYVNACRALYEEATAIAPLFTTYSNEMMDIEQKHISTSDKIVRLFQITYPSPSYYVEHLGGKQIRVDFCKFPELDVSRYDQRHGEGAAQRILNNYNKIPSEKRFDKNDQHQFSDLQKLLTRR